MNETLNTLMTRRSVRAFQTEKQISREDLQTIVDAGRYAPSAMNRQTWTFVVMQNQEQIQSLARAVGKALGRDAGYNFYLPNALILCANDLSANPMGVQDCACALENMFLAAHSLGIGSVWINQLYDTCNEPGSPPPADFARPAGKRYRNRLCCARLCRSSRGRTSEKRRRRNGCLEPVNRIKSSTPSVSRWG